jgi:hypothetical protein
MHDILLVVLVHSIVTVVRLASGMDAVVKTRRTPPMGESAIGLMNEISFQAARRS